jgi:hypothetical protein
VLPRRVTGKIITVATWREFESSAPGVAAMACLLWPGITALHRGELTKPAGSWFSIAYLATSRPDGSPRLHPFCPILAGGRLFAAIPGNSPKGHDLRRDPRCAIHALPGPDDDELSIRARAEEVGQDPAARASVIAVVTPTGVGGMIETASKDPIFEFDILQVDVARWLDIGQRGTRAVRQTWRAP